MKYTVQKLREHCRQNGREGLRFIFFWRVTDGTGIAPGCLSQWYDCVFEKDGIVYTTAEQFMMAQKAVLFGDPEIFDAIMVAKHPREYKNLGRKVRNFDEKVWDANKYDIVLQGTLAKFAQNPEMMAYLLSTGDAVLVEASPYDAVWGVHLRADDPKIRYPEMWMGQNLLGFALMEARDILREQQGGAE